MNLEPPTTCASPPPTRSRYIVLIFLCTMSLILYLDRICLGQAIPLIKKDLEIDDAQMALIAMAFTLAYGLFEVPVGRLGDRHGARRTLTRIVLVWSLFTALTGASTSFLSMLVVRFLFGMGEAGALPNAVRITTNWFPLAQRGRYRGLFVAAASLGGAIAPALAAWVILRIGWRWNFVVFGSFGVVWALAFYWWFRDTPAEHPSTNDAERAVIGPPGNATAARHEPIPWGYMLTNRNILLLSAVITCSAFLTYLFFTWYSDYLQTVRQVEAGEAGWLSSLVLTGSMLGVLLGGVLADCLRTPAARKWLCAATTATAAGIFLVGMQMESPFGMSLLFGICSLSLLCMQPIWWAFTAELGGKHLGSVFGFMNGMGTFGAMGSQLFFGFFRQWRSAQGAQGRDAADPAFWVYFVVLLAAALGWTLLDVRGLRGEGPREQPLAAEHSVEC
jgi:sugar phosphate permease